LAPEVQGGRPTIPQDCAAECAGWRSKARYGEERLANRLSADD
jgi:hypothetical protein